MFLNHLYKKIRIEKYTEVYNIAFFWFLKEMKSNEEEDDEIKTTLINIRKKQRIEEKNREEIKND
jgi:hypothetical protein